MSAKNSTKLLLKNDYLMDGSDNASLTTIRNHYAHLLVNYLSAKPRFSDLPKLCSYADSCGVDEVPEFQIWTHRKTTDGQIHIEDHLETILDASSRILHIGAGNSGLGRRFGTRVKEIVATTLHDEERKFAEQLNISNYAVVTANKYSKEMDQIKGQFDYIVDPNPSTFACCLFHFSRMMISYTEFLKDDGQLLTECKGLSWVSTHNKKSWSFSWDDWVLISNVFGMSSRQVTDRVFSMQRLQPPSYAP